MTLAFAAADSAAIPLTVLSPDTLETWLGDQDAATRAWVEAAGFKAKIGDTLALPDAEGGIARALAGYGTEAQRARGRFALASAAAALPAGTYRIETGVPDEALEEQCLGWLLSHYRFDRYAEQSVPRAHLVAPETVDATRIEALAQAEALTRDLVNTPAGDMGPGALEQATRDLAAEFGASVEVTTGEALLEHNLPMIHAVGRAAAPDRAPRLIDLRWGDEGPQLTLVGKGVCFDTGGLNLKPGSSMGLMKKDMGGAANTLGLARMIMASGLKLRLRLLIPAVENAVSGDSFRPGDILTSRKGLSVEINNTDAEGRLVLADALALADEEGPELIVSMATLTGAARVAVGGDIAPFYATSDGHSHRLLRAAHAAADPVWRMPFHEPYEALIEPGIADLDNAPSGGFAGSITAALFLRRFVTETPYLHFDIYSWSQGHGPARPKGGLGQGGRALFSALPAILDL